MHKVKPLPRHKFRGEFSEVNGPGGLMETIRLRRGLTHITVRFDCACYGVTASCGGGLTVVVLVAEF